MFLCPKEALEATNASRKLQRQREKTCLTLGKREREREREMEKIVFVIERATLG